LLAPSHPNSSYVLNVEAPRSFAPTFFFWMLPPALSWSTEQRLWSLRLRSKRVSTNLESFFLNEPQPLSATVAVQKLGIQVAAS
jgi:hypothetical protein